MAVIVGVLFGIPGIRIAWYARRQDRREQAQERQAERGRALNDLADEVWARCNEELPDSAVEFRVPWWLTGGPSTPEDAATLAGTNDVGPVVNAIIGGRWRRLVIIGEAGSGKTTLAQRIAVEMCEIRKQTAERLVPVPVVLAASTWLAPEPLGDWVVRELTVAYADQLRAGSASDRDLSAKLFRYGDVLPVVDGLDELDDDRRRAATEYLAKHLSGGQQIIVTSRSSALSVPDAVRIELQPVGLADLRDHLAERARSTGKSGWSVVLEDVDREPEGPLATAMKSALLLWLAGEVYATLGSDPAELADRARFPSDQSIQSHLMDRFIPERLDRRKRDLQGRQRIRAWDPGDASRWLTFFASRYRALGSEITWWYIDRALSWPVRMAVRTVVEAVLNAPKALLLGALWGAVLGRPVGFVPVLSIWLVGTVMWPPWIPSALAASVAGLFIDGPVGAITGLLTTLFVLSAVDVLTEVLMTRFPSVAGDEPGPAFALRQRAWWLAIGRQRAWWLASGERKRFRIPSPGEPEARLLVIALAWVVGIITAGAMYGIAFGLGVGLAAGLAVIILGFTPLLGARGDAAWPAGLRATFLGARVLAFAGIAALVVGSALSVTLATRSIDRPDLGSLVLLATGISCVLAIGAAALWTSAWPWYTIARSWFALRGRVPWRLQSFLKDMHRIEVLRRIGPVYQFRHDRLRAHLVAEVHPDALAMLQGDVSDHRDLVADDDGDDFQPGLAWSLIKLAQELERRKRIREAAEATDEAAVIFRTLAETSPTVYWPALALTWKELSAGLSRLGLYDSALQAAREEVAVRRQMAGRDVRSDAELASSLRRLAGALADSVNPDRPPARTPGDEVVPTLRSIEGTLPLHDLIMRSVSWKYLNDVAAERREEALSTFQEAAQIYRNLAHKDVSCRPDLVLTLMDEARRHLEWRALDRALTTVTEAVAEARHPPIESAELSRALTAYARIRLSRREFDVARVAAREAYELVRINARAVAEAESARSLLAELDPSPEQDADGSS